VVSVADGKRAPAARSAYHELGDDLGRREGVYRIRDDGCDRWSESLSIVLSPSHDCRLGDLVHDVVDRLEERLGRSPQWSAWAHRDTVNPNAHLIIRTEGRDKKLERAIEPAARDAYRLVREQRREYARKQEREHGREQER
jgi:hypothetical protein